jgi:thymidylate kinase
MRQGAVFVLFGSDASGKTTQSRLLVDHLRKTHRVHFTTISIRHLIMFIVFKIFDRWGHKVQAGPTLYLPVLPHDRVRLSLEFLSIALLVLKVQLLKRFGYVVVVEKYMPFTLASLIYGYGPSIRTTFEFRMLLRFAQGPCYIMLDSDYSTHLERRGMHSEYPRWIELQRRVYQRFARLAGCPVLNTRNIGLRETHHIIKNIVEDHL